jgi:hypothetical protein
MKKVLVKLLIVFSQIGIFLGFTIFVLSGNVWPILPLAIPFGIFLAMAMSGRLSCIHCSTPLWDVRTIGRWIPVSPNIVDKCGECGNGLFE